MKTPTTMTHIAQQSGVSVAVVSRLLRGDTTLRISEARREQILKVKERLGGVKIRPRKRRLTHVIAVPVSPIFPFPVVKQVLIDTAQFQNFERQMKSRGFRVNLSFFEDGEVLELIRSCVRSPRSCDGVLLLSGLVNEQVAGLLRKHRFPHVSFDYRAERFQVNTVRAHTTDGIRQAVEHLYALGHRRIGFLGSRHMYRYPLVVAALAALQLPLDEDLHCWVDDSPLTTDQGWRQSVVEPFGRWLDRGPSATAIICSNDALAYGALDALQARGLQAGRDLSVVGNDNLEVRGNLKTEHPLLSTVDNPSDIIGRRGADLLLQQILQDQDQVVHERIPAPLIVRGSTGPAPATRC